MQTGTTLVIVWPGGYRRMEHPLPLPAGVAPCDYVNRIRGLCSPDCQPEAWWIRP